MGRYNYWSNMAIKPKRFKTIDGKKKIYSCEMTICDGTGDMLSSDFICYDEYKFKLIDRENVDEEWNNSYFKENVPGFRQYHSQFITRDAGSFIVVNTLYVDKKLYLAGKQKIERERKLKRLLK